MSPHVTRCAAAPHTGLSYPIFVSMTRGNGRKRKTKTQTDIVRITINTQLCQVCAASCDYQATLQLVQNIKQSQHCDYTHFRLTPAQLRPS